mmetsp:Transcript_11542/g.28252  ORF Transcript_11542/g.28252 Transcript_11542/m.28252 type:complete len:297 (-) Transcript_11542:1871-2761(-)
MALASTPGSSATSTLAPLGLATAWDTRPADLARLSCARSASISLPAALRSACSPATLAGTSSGLTLRDAARPRVMASTASRYSTAAAPATASMRRMPDAMPPSLTTLNAPISDVLPTCVPPHSSMETPGTSTTRTTSSYFSPNMAVAPAALASFSPMTCVTVGTACATHPLISRSTCATSAGVMPRLRLKSNLSLCASTSDPCWQVSGPSTALSADCSRWVAVWCARMRRRLPASTSATTACPTRSTPDCTSATCTHSRPPAAFLTSFTSSSTSSPPGAPTTLSTPASPTWPPDSA